MAGKNDGKVDIADILSMTPESLAHHQEKALREFAVTRLRHVANLINTGCYQGAYDMLSPSPAGDGYGCDNMYIDFSDAGLEDIGNVLDRLMGLHKVQGGNKK